MIRRFHWIGLLLAGYWLTIFISTHVPLDSISTTESGIPLDKFAHFGAYFVLALLLACVTSRHDRPQPRLYLILFAIVAAYGALDELSQRLIPTRSADWYDWYADLGGCAVALVCHKAWTKTRRHPQD